MATIPNKNWSFRDPGDAIPDNSTIISGNFVQLFPETPIMVGKKLTILSGNFVNVKKDENWDVQGGNWAQIEFCSNDRPDLVKRGLPECDENCEHMVDENTVVIDGKSVISTKYYRNKRFKRLTKHFPRALYYTGANNITKLYTNNDQGGPVSTALVASYLDALATTGTNCCVINGYVAEHGWTAAHWAIEKIHERGLKTAVLHNFGANSAPYSGKINVLMATNRNTFYTKNPDIFHTNHALFHPDETNYYKASCPNYRGALYDGAKENLRSMVAELRPEFVVMDSEIFVYPQSVEHTFTDILKGCDRCKDIDGYMSGWRGVADDIVSLIQGERSTALMFEFASWNWENFQSYGEVCLASRWWPYDKTFSGPSPAFYALDPPTIAPNIPATLAKLQCYLDNVDIKGGYPWLSVWRDYAGLKSRFWTNEEFSAICTMLKKAGAYGFQLWPGYLDPRFDAALDPTGEKWIGIFKAGVRAFEKVIIYDRVITAREITARNVI